MLNVLKNYYFLLRIDKPIGVYLLLWPSLSAIWLASLGRPDILIIIVFCLGCFLTRSAGVVINDLLDQKLDRKVLRTCLLYTSPSPRDATLSRMPSSA